MSAHVIPTTAQVKDSTSLDGATALDEAEFDAWLARHDAEVAAKAWDEGHKRGYKDGYDDNGNGYDAGTDDYVPLGNPYRATPTSTTTDDERTTR